MMRKIIVYIATSADGYIARRNGAVDWLDRPRTAGDYGMAAFYDSIDTVLMGRKTYEVARAFGQESYPGKKNYVFSRTHPAGRGKHVEFVRGDAARFAESLRRATGKQVWLVGGAGLIGAFLDAGQIDEFIVHVVPTMIGEGIPLIRRRRRTVTLSLLSSRRFSDGVVRLHYAVENARRKRKKAT